MNIDATALKRWARALHLTCTGIAPASLPVPSEQRQSICPLAAGQGTERYTPQALLPGCQSIVVVLFPYRCDDGSTPANLAQYCRSRDYHLIVKEYLSRMMDWITRTYPHSQCLAIADTSPLADRWLAYQAGLGFFGDNHCLINDIYGSYFFIGSILTTTPFMPDQPLRKECLHCSACLRSCPGSCLDNGTYDYRLCKSYLTQKKGDFTAEEEAVMKRTPLIFGCDVCQDVCPHNKKAALTPLAEFRQDRLVTVTYEQLSSLSNRQFHQCYGQRAFAWRGKNTLLRNLKTVEDT